MSVLKREELEKCKSRELARMLSDTGTKGAWEMKKSDIINELLKLQEPIDVVDDAPTENEQVTEEVVARVMDTNVNVLKTTLKKDDKIFYVENAKVGMIVAFKLDGKTKSAMIVKKSTNSRKFMLETAYGASYVVPYEDIVWVKTGTRWPKGVYLALKAK